MANYKTDNFKTVPYMGPAGNLSISHRDFADIAAVNGAAGFANGDTFDISKIPAGALVLGGYIFTGTSVIATSTISIGVKYADGTSTGGTTGTAVLVGGTASAITAALTQYRFRFTPFRNDADTIVYATWLSPGAPSGTSVVVPLDFVTEYEAEGTK